jgi:putative hydrolase of the HAD superfamily
MRSTRPIGQQYAEKARLFGARLDADRLGSAFRRAMAVAPPMAFAGRSFGETPALERAWWKETVRRIVDEAGDSGQLAGGTFDEFFASLYDHFTTADAWELFPDVRPALDRLRAGGVRLGLITNYDTRVFAVLEALGLAQLFAAVVIPAHVGAAKPAPAIFAAALDRLGAAPGDAVHVGDELDDDYEGARAAGLRAVLIDRDGRYRERHDIRRIESLDELTA